MNLLKSKTDHENYEEPIEIAGHTFMLKGRDAHKLNYYRTFTPEDLPIPEQQKPPPPFFDNILAIKNEVAEALGAKEISARLTEKIDDVKKKKPKLLGDIPGRLESSRVQITELGKDSLRGIYSFAFAVDLPSAKIGNISIVAFGLRISYRRDPENN